MMGKCWLPIALLLVFSAPALCSGRDLATDVEAAHTDLLLLSASSSSIFFRTNDIKMLYSNEFLTAVSDIATKFGEIGVDQAIIDKFVADMNQTEQSANNLLQLQLNTFQGYEERVHTYEENLLTNLPLIPENLVQLRKDTDTSSSIYMAVDNNLNTYINFFQTEVNAVLANENGPTVEEVQALLQSVVDQESQARVSLAAAKAQFDERFVSADASLALVAGQVL
ncbi:Hypothetical predicted protein [Cloeon dipterum]|uniref:Uncharacterized protein n=1 Tax=Cloeon dipterum TaxID=197152 RepID=A0A8S1CDD0_9INSE|nr:Hypothetical predicted protein [Cloeon dipterum]